MRVGDLIQHKHTGVTAVIVEEIGPKAKKPYFYYEILISGERETITAPIDMLLRLWEVVSEV